MKRLWATLRYPITRACHSGIFPVLYYVAQLYTSNLGYTAFNASVGGAGPQDSLIIARFIFDHASRKPPSVLLVLVDPGLGTSSAHTALCTPLYLLRYATKRLPWLAFKIG